MNETIIVVNGKQWIIPSDKQMSLISWLQSNAIDATRPQPMQESISHGKELLTENG